MQKQMIMALIGGVVLLSACSSSPIKNSAPAKITDLKHICIKDAETPRIPQFTQLIAENLRQRGITSEIKTEIAPSCRYALAYSLKENDEGLIGSAKLRLSQMNGSDRTNLGEVSYWLKGSEEKAKVAQTGLKGQVKTLVNELLINN